MRGVWWTSDMQSTTTDRVPKTMGTCEMPSGTVPCATRGTARRSSRGHAASAISQMPIAHDASRSVPWT